MTARIINRTIITVTIMKVVWVCSLFFVLKIPYTVHRARMHRIKDDLLRLLRMAVLVSL